MYLYLKCNVKWGTQNINFKIINQHKNDMCHVQSLEKDFYLGATYFIDNLSRYRIMHSLPKKKGNKCLISFKQVKTH